MAIEEFIAKPITGINPFNELPIDADIWRAAHGHHHTHRQLHALSVHRPGIVFGLEVVVGSAERTVVVAPGVGIDQDGRMLVLAEPFSITLEEKGQIYITIQYEDNFDRRSAVLVGSGEKYFRLVEGRQVVADKTLPKGAYLELARVDRSSATKAIKEAANPFDPGIDELNVLYRSLAFPHCYADGSVGELCFLPKDDPTAWKPNRAGLFNLIRYANGHRFHLDFGGLYNLRAEPAGNEPLALYVAGSKDFQALGEPQIEGLNRYLDAGGVLIAEAAGGGKEFAASFKQVAQKVGADLKKLSNDSPILKSHHLFCGPPVGAVSEGSVLADLDRGVILSTFDYGGAWQGALNEKDPAAAREIVRNAQDFGLNLIVYAARRRRLIELRHMA